MKRILTIAITVLLVLAFAMPAIAKPPAKSKFYDFSDQLIDGEIRKPTALYTDARQKAKFDRLLRLKKSFLPAMFRTSKEKTFK
jgi:hypothetical protein